MLKFTKLAGVFSVIILSLTTAYFWYKHSQNSSLDSKTSNSSHLARSSAAQIALASHLKQTGATFYGTHWCHYCIKQKQLFGQEAIEQLNYIECDAQGKNPQPDLCQKANINALPTWEIKGKKYPGVLSLEELTQLSGYQGDSNFGN
jgi:thiol-disulfide isomerase/thioredoxin